MDKEVTPAQAAFLMRHLSDDDRNWMIREAGSKVFDLRESCAMPHSEQAMIRAAVFGQKP